MDQADSIEAASQRGHGETADFDPHASFTALGVTRVVTDDIDEFCAAPLDWNIEMTQLRRSPFEGAATIVSLGTVLLYSTSCGQGLLERFRSPAGCLTFARPGEGSEAFIVDSHEVHDGEVLVCGPGAEGESVIRGVRRSAALSINLNFLESQSHWLEFVRPVHDARVELRSPGREWAQHFSSALQSLGTTALERPRALANRDLGASLVDALLMRVNALCAIEAPLVSHRAVRLARCNAVARAREYIDENLAEPIRLSALCEYARTQARSLEYAFREVLGVSPIAYVRATRLHRVRKLLQSTVVRRRSISELALDCGFWHLSQFAADYKRLFSESPSDTYRRTRSLLPREERRRIAAQAVG